MAAGRESFQQFADPASDAARSTPAARSGLKIFSKPLSQTNCCRYPKLQIGCRNAPACRKYSYTKIRETPSLRRKLCPTGAAARIGDNRIDQTTRAGPDSLSFANSSKRSRRA
ncbi:hypothetical protein [Caballeronia calidae]|uniref:hypothetical protein n=1 Tax=Caballeronia calidae TaxID=1777139 RepID=UPI000B0D831D|nr:hypothetical protein [Caballeronia calidae]